MLIVLWLSFTYVVVQFFMARQFIAAFTKVAIYPFWHFFVCLLPVVGGELSDVAYAEATPEVMAEIAAEIAG